MEKLQPGDLIRFVDSCYAREKYSGQQDLSFFGDYCIQAGDIALVMSIKKDSGITALIGNKILEEISLQNVYLIK